MKLQQTEIDALNSAALLIKYSAESPKTLPDTIVAPIAAGWKAHEENQWSPDVSAKFWTAYSELCDLLKPVTLDTIKTTTETIQARKWVLFGGYSTVLLIHYVTRRYVILLSILLVVSIVFGFIVSSTNRLSDEIHDLIAQGDKLAEEISTDLSSIETDLASITRPTENPLQISLEDPRIKPDLAAKIVKLRIMWPTECIKKSIGYPES